MLDPSAGPEDKGAVEVPSRPSSKWLDEQIAQARTWGVLDKGIIRVVDYMGNDDAIVRSARVSYGKGTKTALEDAALIAYLYYNTHTSPFEMCELVLLMKMPIFVARQWIRHRTASVNEYSLRYSEAKDDFYIPDVEVIRKQSKTNKQGRDEPVDEAVANRFREWTKSASERAMSDYRMMLDAGVARELARINLPLNLYTEWYWKQDLKNLLDLLRLRCDPHAQWEIRQYADVIRFIVANWVPAVYKAWENTFMGARLTHSQLGLLYHVLMDGNYVKMSGDIDRTLRPADLGKALYQAGSGDVGKHLSLSKRDVDHLIHALQLPKPEAA